MKKTIGEVMIKLAIPFALFVAVGSFFDSLSNIIDWISIEFSVAITVFFALVAVLVFLKAIPRVEVSSSVYENFYLYIVGMLMVLWGPHVYNWVWSGNPSVDQVKFVAFEKIEGNLNLAILPFNYVRECKEYDTRYEDAFKKRVENLAGKYKLQISCRINTCEDVSLPADLVTELISLNSNIDLDDVSRFYTGYKSNANAVVYGRYSENCHDSTFVNVDYLDVSRGALQTMLNRGLEFGQVQRVLDIVEKYFPELESFNKSSWGELEAESEFVGFEKIHELEVPDFLINSDYSIMRIFFDYYAGVEDYDELTGLYNRLKDSSLFENKKKLSRQLISVLVNVIRKLYSKKDYVAINKVLNSVDYRDFDGYNYAYLAALSYQNHIFMKDTSSAYEALIEMYDSINDSLYTHLAFVSTGIAALTVLVHEDLIVRNSSLHFQHIENLKNALESTGAYKRQISLPVQCERYINYDSNYVNVFRGNDNMILNYECFKWFLYDASDLGLDRDLSLGTEVHEDLLNRIAMYSYTMKADYVSSISYGEKIMEKDCWDYIFLGCAYHNIKEYSKARSYFVFCEEPCKKVGFETLSSTYMKFSREAENEFIRGVTDKSKKLLKMYTHDETLFPPVN